MSTFLLYSRNTTTTGRRLGNALRVPCGRTPPDARQDVLIRWGSSARVRSRPGTVYNTRGGIQTVTDKLGALDTFRQNHVAAPRSAVLQENTLEMLNYPVLARRVRHQAGTDIVLCMQVADARRAMQNGSEYVIEYIPTRTEYRVHVFGDDILRVSQKVLRRNVDAAVLRPWVRNHETGYIFVQPRQAPAAHVLQIAQQAVQSSNLTFGAVDIIVSDGGLPFVLEVNTGPGLVVSGLRAYAERFASLLGIEELDESVFDIVDGDEEEAHDEAPEAGEID